MGRPRSGSIRRRGPAFLGSVPRLDDPSKRVECTFTDAAAAQRWIDQQLARLARGLPPERPPAPPVAKRPARRARGLSLERIGRAWHAERYDELEHGNGQTGEAALRDLELHIFPAFSDLLDLDLAAGRARIKDWLRAMSGRAPLTAGSPYQPAARPYAAKTVTGLMWFLREILDYARTLGHDVPDYTAGKNMRALQPLGRHKRKAPLVTLAQASRLAAAMHVIHQAVLWILRIGGLRISEAYGLSVANFFTDPEGRGYLLVEAQGGKAFRERDERGKLRTVHRKENGKTQAAYRLLALPRQLTELLAAIIAAYHTSPDGSIDVYARLIPAVRSANGGQHGFRNALARAAGDVGDMPTDPDDYVVPHDMRKGLASDLAWNDDVSDLLARRVMGHRAGSDVFSLVYTLDSRLRRHLAPAAEALEADIDEQIGTLMIPTAKRPSYGTQLDSDRLARADAHLEGVGWQVNPDTDMIGVAEAARHLGMSDTATRRLLGTMIPAVKGPRRWLVSLDDVLEFRHRLDGHRFLPDIAAEAGVDYHTAYRTLTHLGITVDADAHTRTLLISDADANKILDELARIHALRERSMTIAEAAAALRVAHSTIHRWINAGIIYEEPEHDHSDARRVTRASVDAERARRRRPRHNPTVSITEVSAVSGMNPAAIHSLIAAGILVRARSSRQRLTVGSVRAWVTGYRPDLLNWDALDG